MNEAKVESYFNRPISSNRASFSTSPSRGFRFRPSTNISANYSIAVFAPVADLHRATYALNFGVYCSHIGVIALFLHTANFEITEVIFFLLDSKK